MLGRPPRTGRRSGWQNCGGAAAAVISAVPRGGHVVRESYAQVATPRTAFFATHPRNPHSRLFGIAFEWSFLKLAAVPSQADPPDPPYTGHLPLPGTRVLASDPRPMAFIRLLLALAVAGTALMPAPAHAVLDIEERGPSLQP